MGARLNSSTAARPEPRTTTQTIWMVSDPAKLQSLRIHLPLADPDFRKRQPTVGKLTGCNNPFFFAEQNHFIGTVRIGVGNAQVANSSRPGNTSAVPSPSMPFWR